MPSTPTSTPSAAAAAASCSPRSSGAPRLAAPLPAEEHYAWWNTSDDGSVYDTWPETIAYIKQIVREQGPFDGLLGFSQGACLAGVLCALRDDDLSFRFAIIASGFIPRATDLKQMFDDLPGLLSIPTLHIIGTCSILDDPALVEDIHRSTIILILLMAPRFIAFETHWQATRIRW